jgi:hypothetical protein
MKAQKLNKPPKKALRKTDVIKSACINCGKPKEEHSKATELCPTMFAHFEQAVL